MNLKLECEWKVVSVLAHVYWGHTWLVFVLAGGKRGKGAKGVIRSTWPGSSNTSHLRIHPLCAQAFIMELTMTVLLLGVLLALLWLLRDKNKSGGKGGLPPGPLALPLVGNLPQIDKHVPYKCLLKVRCFCTDDYYALTLSNGLVDFEKSLNCKILNIAIVIFFNAIVSSSHLLSKWIQQFFKNQET